MPEKTPRLNSVTSLRYPAAAAVVVTHVNPYYLTAHDQKIATAYLYIGVSFFYLLSGFVLTWSCSRQRAGVFWWNRVSRIWPLQLTMMVVVYVLLWNSEPRPSSPLGWVLQALLLQAWDPNTNVHSGGNGVTWSLSCELFFYAMFPLLVAGIRRLRARGLALTAVGVLATEALVPTVVAGHVSSATYQWLFFYCPAYRIGEFILGMVLARAFARGMRFRRPSVGYLLGWAWFAGWVVVVTEYTLRHHGDTVPRPYATLLVLPAFVLLVVAGASSDMAGRTRLMGNWLLIKLGEWSFALYLVHALLAWYTSRQDWLPRYGGVGYLLVFIALSTAVAAVPHYVLEKPADRWLRARTPRFLRPREARAAPAAKGARSVPGGTDSPPPPLCQDDRRRCSVAPSAPGRRARVDRPSRWPA